MAHRHLSILGGGLAGLALGFFAREHGFPFRIYEAHEQVGGNCRTFQRDEFRFDSGAHRFHDKDPAITEVVRRLLGDELKRVAVPSLIYHQGRFFDFPLSPLNLLHRLGLRDSWRAAREVIAARLQAQPTATDLETFALQTYGQTISQLFLLNYSQKLWGRECSKISPHATGRRLKGLTLGTFLLEAFAGWHAKTRHLDGEFLYPARGIGSIAQRLAESCGEANIRVRARITKLLHDGQRIQALEINGAERIAVDQVVSTLPLDVLIQSLEPSPPDDILALAAQLSFRKLVLVAFFLHTNQITNAGTVYFPAPEFLFTRIYEPKNRSAAMAPQGRTSLVAEIPCDQQSQVWQAADEELSATVLVHLRRLGWLQAARMLGSCVIRLHYAYPVLEKGIEAKVGKLEAFLGSFDNLTCCGRNARFQHASMHEVIRQGQEIILALEKSLWAPSNQP